MERWERWAEDNRGIINMLDINEIYTEMKSIFESKTFWVAVAQCIAGIFVVIDSTYPGIGSVIIAKSFLDVCLRYITTQPIA
jgi:hypothetical protein